MKKIITWMLLLFILIIPVGLCAAEVVPAETVTTTQIWTDLVTGLIGVAAALLASVLSWAVAKYLIPWIKEHHLEAVASVVVNGVEAILGRYCGSDKWELALSKMQARGWDINASAVIDALKAAWEKLNISQIAAGIKLADEGQDDPDSPVDEEELDKTDEIE